MRLCFWLPLVAADFCAHVELWEKLRLEVRQLVPRYSGRLNFAARFSPFRSQFTSIWINLDLNLEGLESKTMSKRVGLEVHLSADLVHVSRVQGLLQELQVPDALLQPEAGQPM